MADTRLVELSIKHDQENKNGVTMPTYDSETRTGQFMGKIDALVTGFEITNDLRLEPDEVEAFTKCLAHHIGNRGLEGAKKTGQILENQSAYFHGQVGERDPENPRSADPLKNNTYLHKDAIYHAAGEFAEFLFPALKEGSRIEMSNSSNEKTDGKDMFLNYFEYNYNYPTTARLAEYADFKSSDPQRNGHGFTKYKERIADNREAIKKHTLSTS